MQALSYRRSLVFWFALGALVLGILLLIAFRSQAQQTPRTITALPDSEAEARRRDPGQLLFRAAEFDPLQFAPAAVRIGGASLEMGRASQARAELQAGDASYWIVQFPDVIQPEQTAALRAEGYEIKAYVPNNAYLVKAPRGMQARLLENRTQTFRWVGAYGPALKVAPELVAQADSIAQQGQVASSAPLMIGFTTFSGESAAPIRTALENLGLQTPPQLIERFDGVTSGRVIVSAAELPKLILALANLEGVEWIEQREQARLENDNAVKIIQAGPTANDTPLYRNGLTGAGQIIGIADSGVDADHAQFRLSGDTSAQTLSFATTTTALVNGALPVSVTNPNNKILTYYVLGAGRLLDNTNNPNGGKVLDPNEQAGGFYVNGVAYDDSNGYHGTHVMSVFAGRDYAATGSGAVSGIPTRTSNDGVAPEARIVFQDAGHPAGQLPGLDIGQILVHQQAYNTGVRIHSNSYGFSAGVPYDELGSEVDQMMWRLRDYTIFFSAGNSGPNSRTITKDTKSALLVGGANSPTNGGNPENVASSSSHGPTGDGRIKPDIVAPSTVFAATENAGLGSTFRYLTSSTANDAAVNPTTGNNNRSFSTISGTSFASPAAAGGATLVRQYFTDGYYPSGARNAANSFNPSNALIKALVLISGRNMTGNYTADGAPLAEKASLPSMGQGWGRMTLDDALYFPGDRRELKVLADIWNGATATDATRPATNAAIMAGQTHTYQLTNVSTVEPLRITLVWSDPNAAPYVTTALINNLNLEVTDPNGQVYRGNVNFQSAYSQPAGSTAFDSKNPLEAVYIQYPSAGTYTVKVIGANVPGNGQMGVVAQPGNQTIDANRQGYALVATGNFSAGAVAVTNLGTATINGGVNADRFVSRNETVTANLSLSNPTIITATNVNVQISVAGTSQVPASLVRINGQAAGQAATMNIGNLSGPSDVMRAFQVTLLNDASIQNGQTITFNVAVTPSNGLGANLTFAMTVDTAVYAAPLANASTSVNGASFAGATTAPGALISSFGSGFPGATSINANAQSLPLPTTLSGVAVRVNGFAAPLLFVGVGAAFGGAGAFQINYQLPFEITPGIAFVEVLHNGTAVTSEFLTVRAVAPGVFSFSQNGQGQGAVLNQNNTTNDPARPEARGRVLQIFATGIGGPLLNSITRQTISLATGAAAPVPAAVNDPLYVSPTTPVVTVGGVAATVEYSGLAPGFVGLWQLNIRLPANAPPGNAVPLIVSADGRTSNQTTVAIN